MGGRLYRGLWLCLAAALVLPTGATAKKRKPPPNVIVIQTDDQPRSTMTALPQVRRLLGRGGVEFTRHYAAWPLCCPARTTLQTGQYAHNHGVRGNQLPGGAFPSFQGQDETLQVWLQRRGYRTVHIGKFLNGYGYYKKPQIPPGWTRWYGSIDFTTYRMWGYTLNENGKLKTYGKFEDENPALYQTDVYARKARDAIRRAAQLKQPLYLSLAPLAVHFEMKYGDKVPPRSAPKYRGRMRNAPLPNDPSLNEADISDKPLFWQAINNRRMTPKEVEIARRHYAGLLEALLSVDDMVASIVQTLKKAKQLDNTYIVFTTDNGYFHGEHRFPVSKYFVYEPSSHLPLFVRGPGIPKGKKSSSITGDVDLAPTVLQMAGALPVQDRTIDGHSWLPLARHPKRKTDRAYLFSVPQTTFSPDNFLDFDFDGPDHTADVLSPTLLERLLLFSNHLNQVLGEGEQLDPSQISGGPLQRIAPGIQGVRTNRWAYWQYDEGPTDIVVPTEVELYDMERDPFQLRNLAREPAYARTRAYLAALTRSMVRCKGKACRREAGNVPAPPG